MDGGPEPFLFSLTHSGFHSLHPRNDSMGWTPIPQPSMGSPPSPGLAGTLWWGAPGRCSPESQAPQSLPTSTAGYPAPLGEGRKEGGACASPGEPGQGAGVSGESIS